MKKFQIQQGDVCIEPGEIPSSAKKTGSLVVRHGETTGHKHVLVCDRGEAEIYQEEKGDLYIRVLNGSVTLVHEEHGPQVLARKDAPNGEFRILPGVFEYDYETEEAKRVVD